jgi:hypothetical protein
MIFWCSRGKPCAYPYYTTPCAYPYYTTPCAYPYYTTPCAYPYYTTPCAYPYYALPLSINFQYMNGNANFFKSHMLYFSLVVSTKVEISGSLMRLLP